MYLSTFKTTASPCSKYPQKDRTNEKGGKKSNKDSDITLLQFFLKLLNFFLKLAKQGIFRVFIDSSLVLDVLGTVGISQSANSFIIIVVCRANVCTLREA